MNKYSYLKNNHGKPCLYCGRITVKAGSDEAFEDPGLVVSIEHKTYPKSKGGTNDIENIAISCVRDNNLRGNIAIELFEPFARVVIQQYPNTPAPILRESLKNYLYHLAELAINNKSGIKNACLATLIDIDKQLEKRDMK